jgi:hypothetical protein
MAFLIEVHNLVVSTNHKTIIEFLNLYNFKIEFQKKAMIEQRSTHK